MDCETDDPWRLRAALAGDQRAWTDLVTEFSDTMWHWARSQGLSREDAEDVCQTVWYRLKDRGANIADARRLPGWLATTTRREAQAVSSRRRATSAEVSLSTIEHRTSHHEPLPDDIAIGNETLDRLAAAFAELSGRCRELLSLLWDNRLSYQEVSEILDMPLGSIGPTRQRCLQALRSQAAVL